MRQLLCGQLAEITDEVTDRLGSEVPEYAAMMRDPRREREFRATVATLVETFLDLLSSGGRLSGGQRAVAVSAGEQRAAEGFALESVLTAVRIAVGVGRERLAGAGAALGRDGTDLTTEGVQAAFDRMHRTLDDYLVDLLRCFEEGFRRVDIAQASSRQMARQVFLRRLLEHGVDDDLAGGFNRAEQLDLDLSPPLALVVLVGSRAGAEGAFSDEVAAWLRSLHLRCLDPVMFEQTNECPAFAAVIVPGCVGSVESDLRAAISKRSPDLGWAVLFDVATAAAVRDGGLRRLARPRRRRRPGARDGAPPVRGDRPGRTTCIRTSRVMTLLPSPVRWRSGWPAKSLLVARQRNDEMAVAGRQHAMPTLRISMVPTVWRRCSGTATVGEE